MSQDHDHNSHGNLRRVQFALVLTVAFMIVEVIGGVISGSLALLADAGHMLTDSMALALAALAFRVSTKPADSRRSYGYQRFQILAAFVNGLSLLLIVGWILYEAIRRLAAPPEVMATTMLLVATAGLVVNLMSFVILHGGDRDNLNIRGAALHVAGDLLGSLAAIIAALVIMYTGWMPIDPLLSVLVAMLILRSAWQLVQRSAHILLEGAPEWLDIASMKKTIVGRVPAVSDIHHVHVWGLTPQHLMLTMHVSLNDVPAPATPVIREVKRVLREAYGISHSTIEVEFDDCADH
ncbi:MAG: cation diffusion facilitator family transporter [Gammaproteobacteria bacterium]|nr:cation diffusion facilitator family transporter [Gammaproteobacteria bacterium]MDH4314756.1 cation diffusion facilitator family transporter [Gammaproteobacteria bacterium]MDH5212842.1 cation diffusion facilitator family transporter [Gammaproteobacteria bacterium]MDH5499514.1 cation diffusion facilitator family transporter [Gammaproteobacteria bacterium]